MARAAAPIGGGAAVRAGAPQRAPRPASTPSRSLAALPSLPAARRASEEVLDRLLRGHGWIVCIGVLLVGIVFLNVRLLELDGRIARDSERVTALRQENGTLRLRSAHLGSSERIQRAAAARGLVWPAPGSMRYVRAGKRDAAVAAGRIGPPQALAGTSSPAAQGQTGSAGQTAQPGSAAQTGPAGTATSTGAVTTPGPATGTSPGTSTGAATGTSTGSTTSATPASIATPSAGGGTGAATGAGG
jgi:hypothetical protein